MLRIGCDPELFLRDKITKDFVSAYGKFPGTKRNPFPVEKGAVQVDGMALEFNIEPATTVEEFDGNIQTVLNQIEIMVNDVSPDLEIAFEPFAAFDPEYFSICDFDSKILGCDPDFDEYGNEKIPPEGMQDHPFRTAAGHVHVGWTQNQNPLAKDHFENCKLVAKQFKTIKGYVPITSSEARRCQFYGAPPSFRPKPYGIELRSPSNLWVENSQSRRDMFITTYKTMMEIGEKHAL